jgi:hypothetical protein
MRVHLPAVRITWSGSYMRGVPRVSYLLSGFSLVKAVYLVNKAYRATEQGIGV